MGPVNGIPVYKDPHAPLVRTTEDGERPVLFTLMRPSGLDRTGCILVHPDRWDEFWLCINQPDIYSHPDVRALFGREPLK